MTPPRRHPAVLLLLVSFLPTGCAAPPVAQPDPQACAGIGAAPDSIQDLAGAYRIRLAVSQGPRKGSTVDADLYLRLPSSGARVFGDMALWGSVTSSLAELGVRRTRWLGTEQSARVMLEPEGYDLLLGTPEPWRRNGVTAHMTAVGTSGFGGTWEDADNPGAQRNEGTFCAVRRP